MPLTFAIGDLHGRFDLLDAALAAIETHADGGTVVFLGDYVDRGPQSREIIERLMAGPPPGWRWIPLMGNHEAMLVEMTKFPEIGVPRFNTNGGAPTLASYSMATWDRGAEPPIPAAYVSRLAGLPLMHMDLHRVYVHAAIDRWRPLHRQQEQTLLCDLYSDDDEGGHGDFHVVHGHQQVAAGPVLKKRRTNLDTFAWKTGRLVIGVFDDELPGGPVEFIEVGRDP